MLCAKFAWNWLSGSRQDDENVKSLQTDRRMDRQTTGDQEKQTWAFSSCELKMAVYTENITKKMAEHTENIDINEYYNHDLYSNLCDLFYLKWSKTTF